MSNPANRGYEELVMTVKIFCFVILSLLNSDDTDHVNASILLISNDYVDGGPRKCIFYNYNSRDRATNKIILLYNLAFLEEIPFFYSSFCLQRMLDEGIEKLIIRERSHHMFPVPTNILSLLNYWLNNNFHLHHREMQC